MGEELGQYHATLVSCKESIDTTTPSGEFFVTVLAAMAQFERDLIGERTRSALAERGQRDGERGGRVPYGYVRTAQSGRIQLDPTAAPLDNYLKAEFRGGQLAQLPPGVHGSTLRAILNTEAGRQWWAGQGEIHPTLFLDISKGSPDVKILRAYIKAGGQ